jgi:hypothetical protein
MVAAVVEKEDCLDIEEVMEEGMEDDAGCSNDEIGFGDGPQRLL